MKTKKKEIVIKMSFDLVSWTDDTTVPAYSDVSSTLKIISLFRQTPEVFTKGQTKIIDSWLKKNSVEKFVAAKINAEKHLAILQQDNDFATEMMWTKRINQNH